MTFDDYWHFIKNKVCWPSEYVQIHTHSHMPLMFNVFFDSYVIIFLHVPMLASFMLFVVVQEMLNLKKMCESNEEGTFLTPHTKI